MAHAGVNQDRIIKQSIARGKPIPEHIANPPMLWVGLELFHRAFWDLTTTRSIGESGASPIPWHVIKMWCDEYELCTADREALFHHVRAMDMAYLEHHAGKMKRAANTEK